MKNPSASIAESDVELRRSPIHGMGVYACRRFEKGDVVLRWDLSRVIINSELATIDVSDRKFSHPFDSESTLILQPPERFVNHSCENNTAVNDFCDVAVRTIYPGEEITSDYSADGSGSRFDCKCGSNRCRGRIE